MNRKKKKPVSKKEAVVEKNKKPSSASTKSKLNFIEQILDPKQFEETALIILNLFFSVHIISGLISIVFFPNKFTPFFHKNMSIDGFQMKAVFIALAVLGVLLGLYYWQRDKISLLDYSHLSLVSVAFAPYLFLNNVLMKDNPVLFFLVLVVCGYVFYRALSKVNFDFLDRLKWLNNKTGVIISLSVVLLFAFFSMLLPSLEKHLLYLSQAFDLAFYGNQLYHMLHEGSSFSSIFGKEHFYYHLSPIHYVTAVPFLAIWENIETLLVVQAAYVALAGIPLYLLTRERKINVVMALIFVLGFMVAPATNGPLNYDYHEVPFFPFFFFWLFYFIEKENKWGIWIFFFLNLIIKEDISLTGICIAFYLLIYKKSLTKEAWIMLGASIFYYLFIVNGLYKTPESEYYYFAMNFSFLSGKDGGIANMLVTFFTNPLAALNYSFEMQDRLFIFLLILLPVLFLPVLTRGRMIILGAILVIFGFLDINESNLRIGNQYSAYIAPVIYYLTLVKLVDYSRGKQAALILVMFFFSAYTSYNYGFFQPNIYERYKRIFVYDHVRKQMHGNCLGQLPKDKKYSVAASNFYTPHLSMRDSVFTLDSNQRPDLWIFGANATHDHRHAEEVGETQKMIDTGLYQYFYRSDDDNCVILKRKDVDIQ